MCAFFGSC
jgi:hypothetical protein